MDRPRARGRPLDHRGLAPIHGHASQQKYQEIGGTAEIGGKSVPLRDASLSGAEIGFAIDINGMPYRFQGIVNGDRIDGRRNEWRATRAK